MYTFSEVLCTRLCCEFHIREFQSWIVNIEKKLKKNIIIHQAFLWSFCCEFLYKIFEKINNVSPWHDLLSYLLLCRIWFSLSFRDCWFSVLLIIHLSDEWNATSVEGWHNASTLEVQCHFTTWSRNCIQRP